MNRFTRIAFLPLALALLAGARAADTSTPEDPSTLRADNKQLSGELATAWKELDSAKRGMAEAQAVANKYADKIVALQKQIDELRAAPQPAPDTSKQDLAALSEKLETAQKESALAKSDLKLAQAEAASQAAEVATLRKQLDEAAAKQPAPVDATLNDKLSAAVKDAAEARAALAEAQASAASKNDELASLKKQIDDLKNAPQPAPATAPAADDDTKRQLADAQDKLSMALHSYALLQDENAQLKAQISKDDSDKAALAAQLDGAQASITSLKAQAAVAEQVDSLRTQLRQSQDEVASLAAEVQALRTRIAISGPIGAGFRPSPTRPGAVSAIAPTPLATAAPAPAPAAAPAVRTHVVIEGDTLSKISKDAYGTPSRWEDILKANKGVIKNDKSLVIGSTLTLP